jgi:hypothetical protein
VQVMVWRQGRQVPVWVEPWVLVQSSSSGYAQSDPLEPLGIVLDDRYQMPVVWKVLPRTPAYYAGVRSGDVIVAWSGQHINDPQDLIGMVHDAQQDQVQLQVSRNRQLRQLTLDLDGQTRTALRPGHDQSYGTTDTTDGYSYGTTRIQSGTYVQPGTTIQGQTYVQPGAYGQAGATFTQPGVYGQTGTSYGQTGTMYSQPGGGTYGQPAARPNLLPRLRGR